MTILQTSSVVTCNITAASSGLTDVQNAVNAASAGQVVCVPAGTSTWNSSLSINKGIILNANGRVNISGSASPFIDISGFPSDQFCRVTGQFGGFNFDNVTNTGSDKYSIKITGSNFNGAGQQLTKVRIDHCTFNKGKRIVYIVGWVYGCIDNCSFTNGDIAVAFSGDDNFAWARAIQAGTANAMFVEDCTFTLNNSRDVSLNEQIYHQEGARSVVRYNTFDGSANTTDDSLIYDSHGNFQYYTGVNSTDQRGQPICEFYNNTITVHHSYRFMNLRGGSNLVHDNAFTYNSGSRPAVYNLTEEEDWQTILFSPLRTVWPAQDQIINTFIYGNTVNGSSDNAITLGDANDSTFIQQDRDYFLHAPDNSSGIGAYTGSRNGGSTTAPTGTDTGNTTFTGAVTQAYYPYSTYTYPNSLRNV